MYIVYTLENIKMHTSRCKAKDRCRNPRLASLECAAPAYRSVQKEGLIKRATEVRRVQMIRYSYTMEI